MSTVHEVDAQDHGSSATASSESGPSLDEKFGPSNEDAAVERDGLVVDASDSGPSSSHGLPAREHATHGQDARATSETADLASDDDSGGSSSTTSGETEKSGATEKLLRIAAGIGHSAGPMDSTRCRSRLTVIKSVMRWNRPKSCAG